MSAASDPDSVARRMAWFATGESRLLEVLATGPDLRVPSRLPGWSRAHLVAHLIGNADALGNLVRWARTGKPTPMYADADARSAQINRDAERADAWLLAEVDNSSEQLAAALAAMSDADWDAPVRTAMGREVSAIEIPWMRARESVIHALDLDLGADLDWCPAPLIDALITDTSATVGVRDGCPAVVIAPDDRDRVWRMGPDGPATTVTGSAGDLLAWVVGRGPGSVALPRWL